MTRPGQCPVCGSGELTEFLDRDAVPVHQNLLMQDAAAAREIGRGKLRFCCCRRCSFVCNTAFDESLLSYGEHYDNTQSHSPAFAAHLDQLVDRLVGRHGVRNCTIVEVGCGKGYFLRRLVEAEGAGNRGVGFDPSYVGPETDLEGRLQFQRRFYDRECAELPADVVVCRHVIEHVASPLDLVRSVRDALAHSPSARVFFETPCVEWILRNEVVWDLFYEHCSLFTAASISTAFEGAGFRVEAVDHVFGGQYLWLEAVLDPEHAGASFAPGEVPELAARYAASVQRKTASWREQLAALNARGPVALWGSAAKGVTFANLVDPECRLLHCAVDINPGKRGRYLPGTGHAIVSPADLLASPVTTAVVLNPVYVPEITRQLRDLGSSIEVLDLMEEGVFKK